MKILGKSQNIIQTVLMKVKTRAEQL